MQFLDLDFATERNLIVLTLAALSIMFNMLPVCGRVSHSQQLGTIMIMKLASPYYQIGI